MDTWALSCRSVLVFAARVGCAVPSSQVQHSPHPDAAGFVLAGGKSTRMGRDKALLTLCGQPLIAHALSILRAAGLSASIAGAHPDLSQFAPVVADAEPNRGPLAGVCAALASTTARFNVLLSVDTPFVPSSLLAYLLCHARMTGHAVTVSSLAGFPQTFPAVIDRIIQPHLQAELRAGRNGCFAAFQAASAGICHSASLVPVEYLAQSGQATDVDALPSNFWFLNLNSPADARRADELSRRRIA